MKFLEDFFDKNRPSKDKGYFYLYEVIQNFFFSTKIATTGKTHIRDRLDIQRVMVVVWLATFPAMFGECITWAILGSITWQRAVLVPQEIGIIGWYNS